jgi:hypothetical protein
MWAPVVARQISKPFSSFCHVFISMRGVISSTASMIRCLKSARSQTFLLHTTSLINPHAKKPHFHRNVTTFLDETFPGRWVRRGGPTAWPPRSQDLTPLDFFARCWISAVRRQQSKNVWQRFVLRSIPKEAFADSFQKLYERCQPCVVKDDDYFEGQ